MNDDTRIPLDDPTVKEVLADLERTVALRDLTAINRSLDLRGLIQEWHYRTRIGMAVVSYPIVGESWQEWFNMLAAGGREVRPIVAILADAGVLGTSWFLPARDRVFEERGWR